MKRLFDLAERRHNEISKVAFAPLAAIAGGFGRAALTAGRTLIRHPGKVLGATLTGMELGDAMSGAAKRSVNSRMAAQVAASIPHNVAQGTI